MKRILTITLILFLVNCFDSKCQEEYKVGVGIRGGWPTGISGKFFIGKTWAIETIVTGRYRGVGAALLLEKQRPAFAKRLYWFYGGGLHGAFYSGQYYNGPHQDLYTTDSYSYGIDAIGGMEYIFSQIPITVGLDVKPALEINYGPYFDFGTALTVRYIF